MTILSDLQDALAAALPHGPARTDTAANALGTAINTYTNAAIAAALMAYTIQEYRPFLDYSAGNNVVGAAGRIRTASFALPAPMSLTAIRVVFGGFGGSATDKFDVGIYDLTGARKAHMGIIDPTALGWLINQVYEVNITGGPVALHPGTYILAWTTKEDAIGLYTASGAEAPRVVLPAGYSQDPAYGYPAETSATGELPATITLPIGTQDATLSKIVWVALLGA